MPGPSAWDVLECIKEEMDLIHRVADYPWRLRICPVSYRLLKKFDASGRPEWMGELFYGKDGHEYIRAFHNEVIPFILHYRVVVDESLAGAGDHGTVVELDDQIEPGVWKRYRRDWDEMCAEQDRRFHAEPGAEP